MDNITTPETAQRLKAAGFPQPEKNAGQFWYKNESEICVIIQVDEGRDTVAVKDIFSLGWVWLINLDNLVYAPAATDILRELGGDWFLAYHDGKKCFVCHNIVNIFYHTNPAEAAALVWLDKHEKQNG